VSGEHDWLLLAPWYRGGRQNVPPRETRPELQKYETSDLVNIFLRDPQRSLKFGDEDLVATLSSPPPESSLKRRLAGPVLSRSTTRKLFLDIHKRFYLVVCELHCDAPGLPSARASDVCEAGFVIRRRGCDVPQPIRRQTSLRLRRIAARRERLARLDRIDPGTRVAVLKRLEVEKAVERRRVDLVAALARERSELADLLATAGAVDVVEGWIPSSLEHVGAWQKVPEEPQQITEAVVPMRPLIPDPRTEHHAGAGRAIFYGLVPTGGADADAGGTTRFDDSSCYEIRCFVRRHDPRCPRRLGKPDCRGEIVWSEPTEIYKLAPHFDLDGTSNRPITIQLPDIPALSAAAAALPPTGPERARAAPVKMVTPAGSALPIKLQGGVPQPGTPGGPGFCHVSIPLITIVATFVFKLFLPIVVLLFGLFALLKLRFCIPPEISISAGVTAELKAATDAQMLAPSASLQASIDTAKTKLNAGIGTDDDDHGVGDALVGPPPVYSGEATADMTASVSANLGRTPSPSDPPEGPPLADSPWGEGGRLEWEDEVPVP
jgi:hypothetical protein